MTDIDHTLNALMDLVSAFKAHDKLVEAVVLVRPPQTKEKAKKAVEANQAKMESAAMTLVSGLLVDIRRCASALERIADALEERADD